jgi:hypothetical protein
MHSPGFRPLVALRLAVPLFAICVLATSLRATPPLPDKDNWRGPCYNCYNYATNRKTVFFAQPPIAGALNCANTIAAATANGLTVAAWPGPQAGASPPGWPVGACPPGQCLVALVADPGRDFHWYRLNGDGSWSHKQGQTPATCFDAAGNLLGPARPPHVAGLGTYGFCSYMCVPAPPAPLPGFSGLGTWRPDFVFRAWTLRGTGVEDLRHDISDIQGTVDHLPTGTVVPDPLWLHNEDFRGFSLAAPEFIVTPAPIYLRVFGGVVAYHSDLEGDQLTQITYYADDQGLGSYLAAQFPTNPKEASPAGDMRAAKGPGMVVAVSFTPACGASDHAIYRGTSPISPSSMWTAVTCGFGSGGGGTFNPGDPPLGRFIYWVVVGQNGVAEGSYGKDSAHVERPEAVAIGTCDLPQDLSGACP